jgi:8-oxo-dGTP diphosphatase
MTIEGADGQLTPLALAPAVHGPTTGGHVEVGEDPAETVRREAPEELGTEAAFTSLGPRPLFLTVPETTGAPEVRHTDVSLWYLLAGSRRDRL